MIKRILLFKVRDDVASSKVEELERQLTTMPEKIPDIAWWSLGHNICSMRPGQVPYTHIWETRYEDVGALQRYTTHPFHTDVVHPFFDSASEKCIVEDLVMVYYDEADASSGGTSGPASKASGSEGSRAGKSPSNRKKSGSG